MVKKYKNLTQYVFEDHHEEIVDEKGKIIIAKCSGTNYFLLKRKLLGNIKVRGSKPNLDSLVGFSPIPKVGEYLVTFRRFLIFE